MREIRPSGSEGGGVDNSTLPTPIGSLNGRHANGLNAPRIEGRYRQTAPLPEVRRHRGGHGLGAGAGDAGAGAALLGGWAAGGADALK